MTDIFEAQSANTFDPNADYWAELTGPGGKFYDPDPEVAKQKLAYGKLEADRTVAHKNSEYDKLREDFLKVDTEYKAGQSLKELIEDLRSSPASNSNSNTPSAKDDERKPLMSLEEAEALFERKFTQREIEQRYTENLNQVMGKLKEKHGSNYQAVLQENMDRLGIDKEFVNDLARKHPQAFIRTFGLDEVTKPDLFQNPPQSRQRSDNFAPANTGKRTWTYYEKMRKENPTLYTSAKIQTQMMKDASELGAAFKDGDFND
jgi:hypothetical protein